VTIAILLRQISRAILPACLNKRSSTRVLSNSLSFSWTGTEKKQIQACDHFIFAYVSHLSGGKISLVADFGNLFQQLFYNGEVHLYDDEIDDRDGQIIVYVALRVHKTSSSLCTARCLNDKLLNDFFNINKCKRIK